MLFPLGNANAIFFFTDDPTHGRRITFSKFRFDTEGRPFLSYQFLLERRKGGPQRTGTLSRFLYHDNWNDNLVAGDGTAPIGRMGAQAKRDLALRRRYAVYAEEHNQGYMFGAIIGESGAMLRKSFKQWKFPGGGFLITDAEKKYILRRRNRARG
ncbi:hypothetical protein [Fimbriimonas ginsengisoli]|nr:hypothetical protein [Fimbriimonas ginsengisoli]